MSNGLSDAHKDYLAAGGVGFIIGDGALNYAREDIVETYYDFQIKKGINFTLDLQGVEVLGSLARMVLHARLAVARAVSRFSGAAMVAIGAALLIDHFIG